MNTFTMLHLALKMKTIALFSCLVLAAVSSVCAYGVAEGKYALGVVNEEIARRERVGEDAKVEDLRDIEVESIDGRKLQAKVIEHDGETLKFYSLAAKREYEVSFDRLSEKTQKLLREKVPTRFLELRQGWADQSHHGEEENAVADVLLGLGFGKVSLDSESFVCFPNSDRFPVEALRGDLLGVKTSLYGAIEYLMDLKDAEFSLKGIVEQPSSQMIICPGFPDRAFTLYIYPVKREYREETGVNDGSKISGYNSIGLVVDGRRQVVAVQLNRTTDVANLSGSNSSYGGGHRLFNFLEYKKSATAGGGVGIRVDGNVGYGFTLYKTRPQLGFHLFKVNQSSRKKPVLVINKSFHSDRRAENYSMLMLHANVGRIILYNIEKNWLLQESDAFKRIDSIDMDELLDIRDRLMALPAEGNDQPF